MAKKVARASKGVKDLAARRKKARAAKGGTETQLTSEPAQAEVRTFALWGASRTPRPY